MTLRDLQQKLSYKPHDIATRYGVAHTDSNIACNIVDHLFRYIDLCLKEDKSKVKVSILAKSFIRSILNDNVKNGINDFIINMNDKEVKSLLDDIQKELNKRDR